ncbi:MAG TPA: 3'-5' exonuclease [Saprospiraceae bacterium]|nr:3'-5' exonuclease [Saprospiraceae bacterium]
MNLNRQQLERTLFLDVETVPGFSSFDLLPEEGQALWKLKASHLKAISENDNVKTQYKQRAGIYAEFGKIICVSVGYLLFEDNDIVNARLKSFSGHDEKEILLGFSQLLTQYYNDPEKHFLCGHNLKEFDIPFLCRRMLIHGIPLPPLLNISGRKPWQIEYLLDTMEMWKFGDFKNYTSLRLLSHIFGIPSPKDDIEGSQVAEVYYEESDVERITKYCEKDVLAVMMLILKWNRISIEGLINEE